MEVRIRKADIRWLRADDRGRRTEDGGQMTEDRGQRAEDTPVKYASLVTGVNFTGQGGRRKTVVTPVEHPLYHLPELQGRWGKQRCKDMKSNLRDIVLKVV